MHSPDIKKLIDTRNQALWRAVSQSHKITLQFHNCDEHAIHYKSSTAIIYIPPDNYSVAAFTHELLHLYLDAKTIYIGACIKLMCRSKNNLSAMLSDALLDHISNTLDHKKMFPVYLKLGFERRDFIKDYDLPKCSDNEIEFIKLFLKPGSTVWEGAADVFIGKFFGIKACPNNTINYTNFLNELKSANSSLFNILDKFWQSWESYDIEAIPVPEYHSFCYTFIDDLQEWALNFEAAPN